MKYRGLAISGHKAAGKDTALDYLLNYHTSIFAGRILRSKTPMVQAFEKATGKRYDKSQDAELMAFSIKMRERNPHIVSSYLWYECNIARTDTFTIVPDIRFIKENNVMMDNCRYFCLQIASDEEVRRQRIIAREGHDLNFNPLDPTEVEIPLLRNHYTVTTDREEHFLFNQLDVMVARYFK